MAVRPNQYIGNGFPDSPFFNGMLDELAIYNRALSPDEVLQLYQVGNIGEELPWLSVDPISGTLTSNSSLPIDITYNSTNMLEGTYTATLFTINNDPGNSIITIPITLSVVMQVPPATITLAGADAGFVGQTYTFTATVEPISTTQPLTYTWLVDGQLPITHTSGLTDTASFTWETPGIQAITVTATNQFGSVSAGHEININDILIDGLLASNDSPTQLGEVTTFTAVITSGTNVYFEWDFGDGFGGSGEVVTHTYPYAGLYTATVTATNSINSSSDSTSVNIYTVVHQIYFPLVIKSSGEILTPTHQYSPLVVENGRI
jgi:PKD repeat protein